MKKAVDWCNENNKRGQAALKTGKFPLIKDRGTIDRRLDGKLKNPKKDHLRIPKSPDEENEIVRYIKNKNRAHQGLSKKDVTALILDVLRIRDNVLGEVALCQVIFSGKGITDQMVTETAVNNINNLLVSTTENGCQDNVSLLAPYKLFD